MNLQNIIARLKLVTVEPVLFLYMMVIFMESNALQELIFVKSCIMLNHPVNLTDCNYETKDNQTTALLEATKWSKYNNLCLFFFTLITTFYVGSWSDRFGRKLPMLVPPVGTVIAAAINFVLSYFIETHVAYFFVSSFVSGVSFGTVGIIATCFGYLSDFTHEKSRTKRITILEAMIFVGGTVGIYIAGVFLKRVHYEQTLNNFAQLFLFEALMMAILIVYIVFRIPNSSSVNQSLEGPAACLSLFSLRHVADSFRTVFRFREDGKRKKIILMLTALFFVYFGNVVQITLSYYYLKDALHWHFEQYTTFHSIQFAVEGFALVVLTFFFGFLRIPDPFVGILGMISRIAGVVLFGLSTNDAMAYSCIALYMFSEFPVPVLRSMLSKTVADDERGRIFAFTTILQNVCFLLGSFVLMTVFTEVSFKGTCFEIAAALQGLPLLIFIYLYIKRNTYVTMYETIENEDGSTTEICNVIDSNSINA